MILTKKLNKPALRPGFFTKGNLLATIPTNYTGTSPSNSSAIFVSNNVNLVRPIGILYTPSVPEPSTLWGLLGFGVWFLKKGVSSKV